MHEIISPPPPLPLDISIAPFSFQLLFFFLSLLLSFSQAWFDIVDGLRRDPLLAIATTMLIA